MDTKKKMQELHDSYKSPEARKAVEYIWDAYTEDYLIERIMEIMKDIADDSEYLATKNL